MSAEIRPFRREDVAEVLALMRALAVFEGYADAFRVTQQDLIEHGLGRAARFGVLVAAEAGEIVGIAVHYVIPWTYDLRPTLILKELFVREDRRGSGAGRALFEGLQAHARSIDAARMGWTVLPQNLAAKRFYARLGGAPDAGWEHWTLSDVPVDHATTPSDRAGQA